MVHMWLKTSIALLLSLGFCSCDEGEGAAAADSSGAVGEPQAESTEPSEFARFVPVGDDEGRFETAIATYRSADGAEVSLIAAVHLADASHYQELQREFENYDVLLYELVADPSVRPTPEEKHTSGPIGFLQVALKRALELEFQLHAIDYTPDNFVHADLTPEGFSQQMEERGETFWTYLWRAVSMEFQHAQGQSGGGKFDLVTAFRNHEGRHTMRMMFAKQLQNVELLAAGGGTVLLDGRNERAVEVLEEQLAAGNKKIGIYYGAAHMPGIERALRERLGMHKTGERWLVAWDITKRPDPARPR